MQQQAWCTDTEDTVSTDQRETVTTQGHVGHAHPPIPGWIHFDQLTHARPAQAQAGQAQAEARSPAQADPREDPPTTPTPVTECDTTKIAHTP